MKFVLFYDTETTGFPLWDIPSEDPNQPHMVQLCAELCNEETGETVSSMNVIIKPDGWVIPDEVSVVHGITTAVALEIGVPEKIALWMFLNLWNYGNGRVRVAHNEPFDMRIIRIAMFRYAIGDPEEWKAAPAFCTQSNSIKLCNLPPTDKMLATGRKGPKSSNLGEAYQHFTGMALDGAHDAAVDVMACKAVYYGIKRTTST